MAGREQQIQQLLQQQGITVQGLRVEDRSSVISVYGTVADEASKQRIEQVIESSLGGKVANHVTATGGGGASGIPGRGASSGSSSGGASSGSFGGASSGSSSGGASGAGADQVYVVKSGDSLSKIAKHFYGDAGQWKKIHEANKDEVPNPDLIKPGQQLMIPG